MKFISIICVVALCGCSIQRDHPGFVYPELRTSNANEWPELKPSAQLARDHDAAIGTEKAPNEILASRIARLRAKAAILAAYRF